MAEYNIFRILPGALTWCLLFGWMGTSVDWLQFMLGISFLCKNSRLSGSTKLS